METSRIALAAALALAACATARPAPTPAAAPAPAPAPSPEPKPAPAPEPVAASRPVVHAPGPATVSLPAPGHPTVAFRLFFYAGSVDDPPGKEGLTALTAEVMAQGGTEKLSGTELARALFPLAAMIEPSVTKETTVFEGACPKGALDEFVPMLEDVVLHPRFDPNEFQRLKSDFIDEIEKALRSQSDEELGKEALEGLLYAGHPYGHYVGGTVQGLKAITLDDVKAQWKRVFVKKRLIVGVAGGYEGDLAQKILADLAALPDGEMQPPVPAPPAQGAPRYLVVDKASPATAISLGFPWELHRGDADFVPVAVAVSALGEHRQGANFRLFRELREVRGLNYGDYAYPEFFRQAPGGGALPDVNQARSHQEFTVWIRPVEPPHKLFALRAALYELDRWAKGGLTQDELDRTRDFLLGYTLTFDLTDSRRLGYALDDRFYGLDHPWLDTFRARMKSLTLAEVNAAVRRWVKLDELRGAIATQGAAALAKDMAAGTPSPIVYAVKKPQAVLDEDQVIEKFPLGVAGPQDVKVVPVGSLFEK